MSETILGGEPAATNPNPAPEVNPAANPEPAAPEWGKLCGDDGAFAENWKEYLPEGLRNEACLMNYHTFPALVQSLVSAQHAVGSGKVAIPTERSTPEELAAFYKAGGRPDNADGYDFSKVELPENVTLDQNLVKEFREFAFEHGISQKAAQALIDFDVKRVSAMAVNGEAARQKEYNETLTRIQNEKGGDWRQYVEHCNAVLSASPGLKEVLESHNLLNNYEVIKFLSGIGEATSESTIKGAGGGIVSGVEERIAALQQPGSALMDASNPGHEAAVEELNRLLMMRKR